MRLGVHLSIAGGFPETLARATRLACTTMQMFSRSPRGGPAPRIIPEAAEQFDAERRRLGIDPLAIHSPYIINLASPEAAMWQQSLRLYREEYARAGALGAQYLVTHVGSHRGQGDAIGTSQVAAALTETLQARSTVIILLENTAGSGQGLGYRFEQLAAIRQRVAAKARVGICLDTAHLFAAGYPIHTEDGLEQTLESFQQAIGMEHLKLIHLNDSKVPFDSRVDRHWHIGQGHIGLEAFRRLVNHPRLCLVPMVLETPKSSEDEDRRNLGVVRRLVRSPRRAKAVA